MITKCASLGAAQLPPFIAAVITGPRRRRPGPSTRLQASTDSTITQLVDSRSKSPPTRQQQQQQQQQPPYSYLLPRQAVALFAAGAVLGPFCDGLHSQHDVLHYVNPTIKLQALHWSFETCWWVPLLFGVAGLILGVSVPLLDGLAAEKTAANVPQQQQQQEGAGATAPTQQQQQPVVRMGVQQDGSWPWVLLCISLFVTQYWLSGVLEQPLLGQTLGGSGVPTMDVLLLAYVLMHWGLFDGTSQGFAMAALTAVCGPAVEVLLVNGLGLYHYTHPVVAGAVPTWIPWVYFCGGPAVGNLGRQVWRELKEEWQEQQQQ